MQPDPVRISKQRYSHMRGILDAGLAGNVVRTRWTVGLREGAGEWFAGLGLGCRLGFCDRYVFFSFRVPSYS